MPAAESAPSFSPWRDADAPCAPGELPAGPAVVQVKLAAGLVDYPEGRSAMVLYLWTADLAAFPAEGLPAVRARAETAGLGAALRFRFCADPDPARATAALLARFHARFGATPRLNAPKAT